MFSFNLRLIVIRSCCRRSLSSNNSNRLKSNVDKVKWTANELMQTAADINMKRSIVGGNNRIANQSASSSKFAKQIFDYFLVVDFEATCEYDKKMDIQEIIEFPCLKVSAKSFDIVATFHQYVRPIVHPQLSAFCTELTGIIQPTLTETLRLFEQWLIDEQLISADAQSPTHLRWIIVTCGDWDLSSMLVRDCAQQNIDVPWYLRRWINVKRSYADATGTFPRSMMTMIDDLQLKHVGRQHSGIDDCRNITAIVRHLAKRGDFVFEETSGEHLMY